MLRILDIQLYNSLSDSIKGPSIKYVTLEGEGVREGVIVCDRRKGVQEHVTSSFSNFFSYISNLKFPSIYPRVSQSTYHQSINSSINPAYLLYDLSNLSFSFCCFRTSVIIAIKTSSKR